MASCPRLRPTTTMLQAGHSTLRRRRLESDAASWTQRLSVGGTVLFAAKKIRIGRVIVAATSFRRRAVLLAGTIALHRFSISSPDLRIDAAKRSKQWQSLQPKGWSIVPRPKSLPAGRLGLGNTALPGNAAVGVVGVLLVEL